MEAVQAAQEPREFEGSGTKSEPNEKQDAVQAVKRGSKKAQDLADATAWFLSDEPTPRSTKTFGLNVGRWNEGEQRFEDFVINWTVVALPREAIRRIQRLAIPARQRAGGSGEADPMRANLGIAAEGTLEPDLKEIAASIGSQDPTDVLRRRFEYKPGLIDQIASEVLSVSGYDDADIRDAQVVRD